MSEPTRYAVGVDIGGTFTDCVVVASDGQRATGKVPTTPADRSRGFFASIEEAAGGFGVTVGRLMAATSRIIHGTTTGVNALVSRTGARTGLITTKGHSDVLFIMKGGGRTAGRPADDILDLSKGRKPSPLIPRELIAEVAERIDREGDVIVRLDEDGVRAAVRSLLDQGVKSIAISLLWSIRNQDHEHRIRELVAEIAPDVYVTCGSDVVPHMGEYERTVSAVMNAYIGPLMVAYVDSIENGAKKRGYTGSVLFASCVGGAITGEEARLSPILTAQSGPVAGVTSAVVLAREIGAKHVITADMGGTTFDSAVLPDGEPLNRRTTIFQHYEMALPMVDVESVGAGGGSIAWLDASGRLNVGPLSAGADPGPVCYGRGGTQPTVTDADVALGLIDPERFLHGEFEIDMELALRALGELGEKLGLDPYEMAAGITTVVDARMADLLRSMTIFRGLDPREFACFSYGGGGPVHAAAVARDAGLPRVVVGIPVLAPVWSAAGAAISNVVHVFSEAANVRLPAPPDEVESHMRFLEEQAVVRLRAEGFDASRSEIRRRVAMRYALQVFDVEVEADGALRSQADVERLTTAFHAAYEQRYGEGSAYREGGVEITSFQVRATGLVGAQDELAVEADRRETVMETASRQVYWPELKGFAETPVLRTTGGRLVDRLEGPLLIELPDTVAVVRPGQSAAFDAQGNLVIDVQPTVGSSLPAEKFVAGA